MRPLKLTLEAFGPFAGKEIVDFTRVSDQQLFGIYGETGSGKSSIFEAIAYALFGQGINLDLDDLFSAHSDISALCKVQFIFEASNRKYLVERSRTKKHGTRQSKATSYLFDVTDISLEDLSDANRGQVLVEKKGGDTTDKIEEILGYGSKEFSQIVLLPQGKFQDFLLANTGEKLQILSTLFDVSLYAKLSKKFSDDSKAIITKKEDLKNNKIGVLLTKEFNSSEELETSLAHEKNQTKSLSVNAINLKKDFEKVRDLKQEFERLVAEEETLSALLDNKDEFDQLREYIDKLKNAEKLQPLHTSLKDKKNKHTNATNQLNLSKDELEKTENRLESYNNDMSSIEEKKENFNLKREKLKELKDFRERFKISKKDQEELNLHDNDIKELNKYIEKKELDHQLKGVLANEELQQNFKKIKDEVARLETSTAKLEKQLDTANMAYEKAEQDLSEMQAIHLSRKLIEGKPCPVCGSHNHPNPAKGLAESKGLNDAFESAKEERDTITVDHSDAKNSLENKKFQLGVLNKTLSDKETPLLSSKEIKVQISALGYEENEEYEQHDSKTLKNIRDQRNESRNRVIGRLDELLKGIPEELRNTEVIKRKIDDLEIKINDYDNEIKSLNDKISEESENKVGLKQRIVVQKGNVKEAINDLEKAEEKLTKDLKKYSLGDEEFETLLAEKSQIAIKEKELNKYDSSIIEARGVIKSIKKSLKNIDQNSAIELQEKFDETKRLSDEAQEKLSSNNNEIKTLEKLKEKVDEIDQELRDLDQEHSSLINLSNAFNGKEGSQHIGLETFALRKMFELVLLAANKRLSVMTKRYKLEIKTETKGRGQQGLDISVHDIFTDESRPAKTLSGGEKFMASLSLALGLSDIIQNSAKRNIRLDTIFIDEGFGSLDNENGFGTLGDVLNTLQDNIASSRAVGLVSHVDTVKSAVPNGFYIEKTPIGSHVKILLE